MFLQDSRCHGFKSHTLHANPCWHKVDNGICYHNTLGCSSPAPTLKDCAYRGIINMKLSSSKVHIVMRLFLNLGKSTVHFGKLFSEIWKCFTYYHICNFVLGDNTCLKHPELSLLNAVFTVFIYNMHSYKLIRTHTHTNMLTGIGYIL